MLSCFIPLVRFKKTPGIEAQEHMIDNCISKRQMQGIHI